MLYVYGETGSGRFVARHGADLRVATTEWEVAASGAIRDVGARDLYSRGTRVLFTPESF